MREGSGIAGNRPSVRRVPPLGDDAAVVTFVRLVQTQSP